MKRLSLFFGIVFVSIQFLFIPTSKAHSQRTIDSANIVYQFFPTNHLSLEDLSSGTPGAGVLVYYLEGTSPEMPKLIVRLENTNDGAVTAEVYDHPAIAESIQVDTNQGIVNFYDPMQPTIIIQSLDGWWTRLGQPSFNLDVTVFGPIHATWGGETILALDQISKGDKLAEISIRDSDQDGLPDWDFRRIIPAFSGFGVLRTNYVEKKCSYAVSLEAGVSPLWPYVAFTGRFEQAVNALRPPIVVDWDEGEVKFFSEIVTARVQPCSYTLYTLDGLTQETNAQKTDFESPFSFYNLSGETVSYANLILRTERFYENNAWIGGNNPAWETIRYSWRNQNGDWFWDYKVEVLGFNPYRFNTSIAGGGVTIDAPPYAYFPSWVLENTWPIATFVDVEGKHYRSSEGLYEWSPKEVGINYFLGRADEKDPQSFSNIREGFRGEFRTLKEEKPCLYLSEIDNRLHLLGAEGGLWNLGDGSTIKLLNLSGDEYIDGWIRLQRSDSAILQVDDERIESLFHHNGYLIYINPNKIILKKNDLNPNLDVLLPPHDHETWLAFRTQVEPITDQRKNPFDLQSWMASFEGETLALEGAALSEMRLNENRFSFALHFTPDTTIIGTLETPIQYLDTGKYWVEVANGKWHIRDFVPAQVVFIENKLAIERVSAVTHQPVRFSADVHNIGDGHSGEITAAFWVKRDDSPAELVHSQAVNLEGSGKEHIECTWYPEDPGDFSVALKLTGDAVEKDDVLQADIQILPSKRAQLVRAFTLSQPSSTMLMLLLGFSFSIGGAALMFLITRGYLNK